MVSEEFLEVGDPSHAQPAMGRHAGAGLALEMAVSSQFVS